MAYEKPLWDTDRMRDDIAELGFAPVEVFRLARIELSRGYKFLSGRYQSVRTAAALSRVLGKSPRHYLIRRSKRRVAA